MAGIHITQDDLLFAGGDLSVEFNSSTGNYIFDVDASGASATGNDTEIQFNEQGTFGSSSKLTFDETDGLTTEGFVLNSDGSLVDPFGLVKSESGDTVASFNETGIGFSKNRAEYALDTRGGRIRSGELDPVENLSATPNVSGSLEVEYYVCAVDRSGANTEAKKVEVTDVPDNTESYGIREIEGNDELIFQTETSDPAQISVGDQFTFYYVPQIVNEFRFPDGSFEAKEKTVTVKSIDSNTGIISITVQQTLSYEGDVLGYIRDPSATEKVDISWDEVEGALYYAIGKRVPSKDSTVVFVGRTSSTSFEDFTTAGINYDTNTGFLGFRRFVPGATGYVGGNDFRNKTGDMYVSGNLNVGDDELRKYDKATLSVRHNRPNGSGEDADNKPATRISQSITEKDSVLNSNFNQTNYSLLSLSQNISPETEGNTDSGVGGMSGVALNVDSSIGVESTGMSVNFSGTFNNVTAYKASFDDQIDPGAEKIAYLADLQGLPSGFTSRRYPRAFQIDPPGFDSYDSDNWYGLYVGGVNSNNHFGGRVNIGSTVTEDQEFSYLNIRQQSGRPPQSYITVTRSDPSPSALFIIRSDEEIFLGGDNKVNIESPKIEIEEPADGVSLNQILTRNPTTGEIEKISSTDIATVAATGIQAGLSLDSTFNASTGITTFDVSTEKRNVESEFVLRDSTTGELITLDDESSSPLQAKYEGNGAFTLGHRSSSTSIGESSVAIGGSSTNFIGAESDFSITIGSYSIVRTPLGGSGGAIYGTSIGHGNDVSGEFSFSIGGSTSERGTFQTTDSNVSGAVGHENTIANSSNSYTFGQFNSVTSNGSLALGHNNSVSSGSSYAIGYKNSIDGDRSIAIGSDEDSGDGNDVSGDDSIIIGNLNTVENRNSIAIGNLNTVEGRNSIVFGDNNYASRLNSVLIGSSLDFSSSSKKTYAIGNNLNDTGFVGSYQFIIGEYNKSSIESTLFALGNGSINFNDNVVTITDGSIGYVTQTNSIILNDSHIDPDELLGSSSLIVSSFLGSTENLSFNLSGETIRDSFILGDTSIDTSLSVEVTSSANIFSSIISSSNLISGEGGWEFTNTIFINSSVDESSQPESKRSRLFESFFFKTDIVGPEDEKYYDPKTSATSYSDTFAVGNRDFIVHTNERDSGTSEFGRSGSVVIGASLKDHFVIGNGNIILNDGEIGTPGTDDESAHNSIAMLGGNIAGTTGTSTTNSLAIGPSTIIAGVDRAIAIGESATVSTSNKIAIGSSNGTDFYNSVTIVDDEIDIQTPGNGVIVTTPDGTEQYRISVDNNGNVTSEQV